ncbi:MAG: DUF4440 domain-containing protein [Bacteroidetes bacterium]|nr:DUF4440 domain-containing protein [Bacteroidota bacterium]MDA1119196.1 DUF4440 domain-containing protein [Bacteroidota bacterium]
MMKFGTILFIILTSQCLHAQSDREAVLKVLNDQSVCWNAGDIDCFMESYWNSDSLMFIGSNGITYGWQATMNRYKKVYPNNEAMGELIFTILEAKAIATDSYLIVGRFYLKRVIGDLDGIFTLVFNKINGNWLIISDHTG